ncbi:MAG: response regulator [Lachnospiraceae bacterium]|nr:response regulator [Lachnospiraceae bacterium]
MGHVLLIFSFSVLIAAMWMAVYVFFQAPSKEQKYTVLLAVCNFIMTTGNLIATGSRTEEAAEVGLHIMFMGGTFVPFCILLICASICHYKIQDAIVVGLSIINLAFTSIMFTDSGNNYMYHYVNFYRVDNAFMYQRSFSFMYYFFIIYITMYLASIFVIIYRTRKTKPVLYKNLKATLHNFIMTSIIAFLPFLASTILPIDIDLSCYGCTFALVFFINSMHRERIYTMKQDSSELILNDLDDILLVHDVDYRFEYANEQTLLTFPLLNDIPYNVNLKGHDTEIDNLLALNDNDHFAVGNTEYLCRIIPVTSNDKLTGYIRWLHDETDERKYTRQIIELKEAAEAANQAKSKFIAHVSHEIRTPINAVIGMNELIVRESNEDVIISYAEQSLRAGRTLLFLINDILDFSKLEAAKMVLVSGEYDTAQMIDDINVMTQFRAEEKGLEFIVNVDDSLPETLIGDETRVKQIITNIVTNGVKYTEKGSVTLDVSYVDGSLKIVVSDTGIGIKKEDMDKLFESFERIENATTHKTEGTGLGMSIVSSLLKMMNGRIEVESEPGKGSVFTVYIPQQPGSGNARSKTNKHSLAGTGRLADVKGGDGKAGEGKAGEGKAGGDKTRDSRLIDGDTAGSDAYADKSNTGTALSDKENYSEGETRISASNASGSATESIDTASPAATNGSSSASGDAASGAAANEIPSATTETTSVSAGTVSVSADKSSSRKGVFQAPTARIMIVDDTKTNLFVATSLIKRTKIITDTASSGKEFLEKAAGTKYDIIFMDYRMPVMDGLETIQELRKTGGINSDTTIVMMTAAVESDSIALFKENGINDVLIKPINPAHYETMLASLLPEEKVIYL